ncbi:hypothetical protein OC834_003620 [Tilletia horrida]|uniref:Uncharacterized protein n=1 Tax=Tilletia horrida TaxID=155126 RepID=A0AAN6GCY4_9BASI|nr:hypothetical protein OC834_003620 [Tilletia horrida]KAK0530018.1 hypothetical protein OC842_004069 [Tilletia horrida]
MTMTSASSSSSSSPKTHKLPTLASLSLALLLLLSLFAAHAGVHAAPAPVPAIAVAARYNFQRNNFPAQPQPVARGPDAEVRALRAAARVEPSPVAELGANKRAPSAAQVTHAPGWERSQEDLEGILRWYRARGQERPTPVKRDEQPPVPLSQLGPPSFPAQYPSCEKCEEKYSSLSSCMEASAVFQNATNIFNNPLSYFAVIKCACTDTFQAVYPQCLDCFQHTNQCWYLGTDPQGTGAPAIISNIRNICGFGSALLGGVATANGMNGTGTTTVKPSSIGTYTDVNPTDYRPGYNDQSTGPIFGGAGAGLQVRGAPAVLMLALALGGLLLLA